ncbi:MAG: FtsX-like permease family protein [Bacteroidales bacterium]|nr:FtsX-like permease family protein [Bacteroidales bacterium]
MNLSFYIAKRYFKSKKSHNVINIISMISVIGVTIGTMALIIVLSVFNGFEKLVVSLFDSFNPDIQITLREGKIFPDTDIPQSLLKEIPGVVYLTEVMEENALMRYKDKQTIVTLKGVGPDFQRMTGVDTMMVEGRFLLRREGKDFAVLGYGVAYYLNANLDDYLNPITVFVPSRTGRIGSSLEQAFSQEHIFPAGFFSIQQDFDMKYAIMPLRFIRKLLDYTNQITAIEIKLQDGADHSKLQKQIEAVVGEKFVVKNRFQQQELLYNIMKSEKWAIFLILAFILLLATFNVVGSLSMLILDKKKDIAVLQSMGASRKLIKRIFMTEGMMISLIGAVTGMIIGGVICWLQQVFGLIRMGGPDSTFVVDSYPVQMQPLDFILVFLTVVLIGYLATWYPVYNIRKINTSIVKLD